MSLKDILVVIDEEPQRDVAGPYALSLAAMFDAHLTGMSVPLDPLRDAFAAGIPEAYVVEMKERADAATATAAERFRDTAHAAGVGTEFVRLDQLSGLVRSAIGELGRHFDLAITAQPEDGGDGREAVVDALLFGSGRPVLVVPYIHREPARLDTVVVAWDGSEVAARALSGSNALLRKARTVEVVTVGRGRRSDVDFPGFNIARHLARHGIAADLQHIAGDLDPANALLSHAADSGADLIVMGGYGNMRLRDLIFGGTTRGIMESMTVPVLMAH